MAAAGVLLAIAATPASLRRLRSRPLFPAAALALIALLALATALAEYPRASVVGTYTDYSGLLFYLPGIIAFLASAALVRTVGALDRVASVLSTGAIPVLAYGVIQLIGVDPIDWDTDFGGRVFSTLGQPLVFGGYLATMIPVITWLGLRRAGWERAFMFAEAAVALALMFATGTRGAILGLTVGVVVILMMSFSGRGVASRRSLAVAACTASVAMMALLVIVMLGPARVTQSSSIQERADLWRAATGMVADRPASGWGPDQFATLYGSYRPSSERGPQDPYDSPSPNPHNELLMIGVAAGVPGMLLYAALWAGVLGTAATARLTGERRTAVVWLSGAAVAALVQAQFSIPDASVYFLAMAVLGSLLGMSAAAYVRRRAIPRNWSRHARIGAWASGGVLVAVGAVMLAADAVNATGEERLAANPTGAVDRLELAEDINPFQSEYALDIAHARGNAAARGAGPDAYLAKARTIERMMRSFGAQARHHLAAAEAYAHVANRSMDLRGRMEWHLMQAQSLDPRNPGMGRAIAAIEAMTSG